MAQGRRLQSYLQWYPFSRLSPDDWCFIGSDKFYEQYIKEGAFIIISSMNYRTNGFIQKQGVAFRESVLISPVNYLYILAFGIEYHGLFKDSREDTTCEYAGDLACCQVHYGDAYRRYCSAKRSAKHDYKYYLKTDISNFFGSISVDSLITKMQGYTGDEFTIVDGLFIRALLLYCGAGKYPVIQNHPTLSFLATKVFLLDADKKLETACRNNRQVQSFKLIRYVDDLYVFFNTESKMPSEVKNGLLNLYADFLRDEGLTLNQAKVQFGLSQNLPLSELTNTYTDCYVYHGVEAVDNPIDKISFFFDIIRERASSKDYVQGDFDSAVQSAFPFAGNQMDSLAQLRHCIFRDAGVFRNKRVIDSINAALSIGLVVLTYNTDDLVKCILNTRDEVPIKRLLRNVFNSAKSGTWSSLSALISVCYLLNRGFSHHDLLITLERAESGLYSFIERYCLPGSLPCFTISDIERKMIRVLDGDLNCKLQYVNQLLHKTTHNYFEYASYYRSFFDRFSSLYCAKNTTNNDKKKQHKIKWLYKEKELRPLYSAIEDSSIIIRNAEDLRQKNPLIHASSELIRDTYIEDIEKVVQSLRGLIEQLLSITDI